VESVGFNQNSVVVLNIDKEEHFGLIGIVASTGDGYCVVIVDEMTNTVTGNTGAFDSVTSEDPYCLVLLNCALIYAGEFD
jgi:hypothetical protein